MRKIKIYIYPNARGHVHDIPTKHLLCRIPQYVNTVPLSEKGIRDHCEIVPHKQADYFYMGQYSELHPELRKEDFNYFEGNEERHIIDIEGDWRNKLIPEWLHPCILTINGAKKEYQDLKLKMFVRPTFSFLLMSMVRGKIFSPQPRVREKAFFFRGCEDPFGVRKKMKAAFDSSGIGNSSVEICNQKWQAQNHPGSKETRDYVEGLETHTFSLCPSGCGVDSIRFYESCFLGAIPILISNCEAPFQEEVKESFCFHINPDKSEEEIKDDILTFSKITDVMKVCFSKRAMKYFKENLMPYFQDPTLSFLRWLERKGL